MTEKQRPAWELEGEARAVNAKPWEPRPAWSSARAIGAATSSPHQRPATSGAVRIAARSLLRRGSNEAAATPAGPLIGMH